MLRLKPIAHRPPPHPWLRHPLARRVVRQGARAHAASIALALLATACGQSNSTPGDTQDPTDGVRVLAADTVQTGPLTERLASLNQQLELSAQHDRAGLLAAYSTPSSTPLNYTARDAEFVDRIQASALALTEGELSTLDANGFVISTRQTFPTFLRGYAAIYMEDLPVYVTADAILDALHRSYDDILFSIEDRVLKNELQSLLDAMSAAVMTGGADEATKLDAKMYLDVARGLLSGRAPAGSDPRVEQWIAQAVNQNGLISGELFATQRLIDTSQFTPRGHYAEVLPEYFRAMMWLGRIDLRLVETLRDGTEVFRRSQYDAALTLWEALSVSGLDRWEKIDATIRAFVGESDNMVPAQLGQLVEALGGLEAARAASDVEVMQHLLREDYGKQQIASHLMVNDGVVDTLPLNRSFLLFGQRYIADSHVLSEVVYDRLPAKRMMPNPLDAAFAALGNNQALPVLGNELDQFEGYPAALSRMRSLIDSHDDSFWNANLYNLWSSSLRTLSSLPPGDPTTLGLPAVTGTEAWSKRILNTQLGSWAQLRHDTLLYAKQSYSGIPGCEFPDAYIEPYPEFFGAIERYAERGLELLESVESSQSLSEGIQTYFGNLSRVTSTLKAMAEQQRSGIPHSASQLAFINEAVRVELESAGCTTIEVPDGWYADLFFDVSKSIEEDPTIADVHTQPADEEGNIVGRILHVGTSWPRVMTMTVDTCSGPRAYAGMVFSYHEQVTENFERLNDEQWLEQVESGAVQDVPWMQPLIAD